MFARVPGVLQTETGYCQGSKNNPTFDQVCSGMTGHNEVVKVMHISSVLCATMILQT